MFVRIISVRESIDMSCFVVIGEGTGAVLAATWVHDFAPRIRGLVLVSPALGTGGWPANALKLPDSSLRTASSQPARSST